MKTIVISIGGSVLLSAEADTSFLLNLKHLLEQESKKSKIYLIVGGGHIARHYIKLGRELQFSEDILDQIGIDITRVNASLLANLLKSANTTIPHSTTQAAQLKNSIVVMGGTNPGHSTDMVGAELAEKVHADLYVIATNVDGIFDKDPNKYDDAQQITEITIDQLITQFGTSWESAGKNTAIDGPALSVIQKSKISTVVLNGKRLDELQKSLNNEPFDGTIIK